MGPTRSLLLMLLLYSAALAAAILLVIDIDAGGLSPISCDSFPSPHADNTSDLDAAFRDLIAMDYLAAGDRALCVGPDSSDAADAARRAGLTAAVRSYADPCCGLPLAAADSFDFALASSLDRVRVPARLVLEMERVVRPGRVGVVMCVRSGWIRPEELMTVAAPVGSLLRFSDVIGARAVNGSAMVVFRKRGPPTSRKIGGHHLTVRCDEGASGLLLLVHRVIVLLQSAVVVGGGHFGHFLVT